jgi:hypothetical protein
LLLLRMTSDFGVGGRSVSARPVGYKAGQPIRECGTRTHFFGSSDIVLEQKDERGPPILVTRVLFI